MEGIKEAIAYITGLAVKAEKPETIEINGRKCWKHPEADRLAKEQGAKMLCTECAIKAGLLSPFRKEGPNRAQRRRAKRERRK